MINARLALAAFVLAAAGCTSRSAAPPRTRLDAPPAAPNLMFVDLSGDAFKHVVIGPLADPARSVFVTPLVCERAYFAGRRGLCLSNASDSDLPVRQWAVTFDRNFKVMHRFPMYGVPSRVRVSPDGRWAATTLFSEGHSYAEHGFATTTSVFDLESNVVAIDDLETLTVRRNGATFKERDFNFWGVTFARDSDTFYATLASGGHNYLVRGSVTAKTAVVIHDGVECPSLSPDNRRIAFKKRIGGGNGWWQIDILGLDTMAEKPVWTESRSVDDQVEWLDDGHVMYHLTGRGTAADIWVAAIDGSSAPRILVPAAYSPAVVTSR